MRQALTTEEWSWQRTEEQIKPRQWLLQRMTVSWHWFDEETELGEEVCRDIVCNVDICCYVRMRNNGVNEVNYLFNCIKWLVPIVQMKSSMTRRLHNEFANFLGLVNIVCYLNITAGRFLNPCRLNSRGGRPGGTVTTTNCIPEDTWEAFNISTMNTLWQAGHAPYFLPSNPLLKINVSWWLSSFIHIKTKENIKLLDFLYCHNLEDTFSSWHRV